MGAAINGLEDAGVRSAARGARGVLSVSGWLGALGAVGAIAWGGAGCGPKGSATPEEAARALIEAARSGDAAAFRAAFPSREELGQILSCPAGIDLAARFDGLGEDLKAWRERPPALLEPAFSQTVSESVVPGGGVGGCEAKEPLVLVRMDVRVREGEDERLLGMRLVGFDGRFRVLGY